MDPTEAFDRAISSHGKWKYRLMEAIETGKSQWHVAEVRTDNSCEFGKWFMGLSLSQKLSEHYKKVSALHSEFHILASEVLELALAGQKEEAQAKMAFGSHFAIVSSNLTMAVLAWQQFLGQNPS